MNDPVDTSGPGGVVMDEAVISDEGLLLPVDAIGVLDVQFDGRRIWSIDSERFDPIEGGWRFVAWPEPLLRYLDGRTRLVVLDHTTQDVKVDIEASFGTSVERIAVVDRAGREVALTKWGRFGQPFDTLDRSVLDHYMDQVEEVLAVLRDECGLPGYVAWGSLLGALRGGRLIGHDVDVDLAYVSQHDSPADITRESFQVEAALRRHGWQVRRENMGFLALFLDQADGSKRNLDVFTSFVTDGWLYVVHDVRTRLPMSALLPLGEVELEGRTLPAPADPEALMTAAYGPGWRTPDPSFKYEIKRPLFRRINGWLGGIRMERDYWEKFYPRPNPSLPTNTSRFARWVAHRDTSGLPLVEIGHGNGRDLVWFAREGRDVLGVEFAWSAMSRTRRLAKASGVEVEQWIYNLNECRHAIALGGLLAHSGPYSVYARMFIEGVRPQARHNLWRVASMASRQGGRLYLEFRAGSGDVEPMAKEDYTYRGHARYLLTSDEVATELASRGATIVEQVEGFGLAPFENEDPYMCRMVVEWT
jgi:SAM-dependent methyltransferase